MNLKRSRKIDAWKYQWVWQGYLPSSVLSLWSVCIGSGGRWPRCLLCSPHPRYTYRHWCYLCSSLSLAFERLILQLDSRSKNWLGFTALIIFQSWAHRTNRRYVNMLYPFFCLYLSVDSCCGCRYKWCQYLYLEEYTRGRLTSCCRWISWCFSLFWSRAEGSLLA